MNELKRNLDFRRATSMFQAMLAAVLVLAGIDALFTRFLLKHTSPMVGGALLIFGLIQLPWLFKSWRSRGEQSVQDQLMKMGTEMPISAAPLAMESSAAFSEQGMVIARYGYKPLNKIIGLFVTAIFAAVGAELLFVHRFIPARPERGLNIFAWAALLLGIWGIISAIRSLLFPKSIIVVEDKGLTLNIAGFGGQGILIPWSQIRSLKLTRMPSSGNKLDALGLTLAPSFPLPKLLLFAALANQGEVLIPINTLDQPPAQIYEKIFATWSQYKPLS